jgi:hypothetical protein
MSGFRRLLLPAVFAALGWLAWGQAEAQTTSWYPGEGEVAPVEPLPRPLLEDPPTKPPLYAPPPTCCHQYRGIQYRNHRLWKKPCHRCEPPVEMVLYVQDPRCGRCAVEVPVYVPARCAGSPQVHSHVGLLGCGYVTYKWCGGFTIKVVLRRSGEIIVHYFGL